MVFITELTLRTGAEAANGDQAVAAINITKAVTEALSGCGIKNGMVTVETASPATGILRMAAGEEKVVYDVVKEMRRLVPARINFKNEESPEQAAGCIKSALFGASVTCVVKDGALAFGKESGIYFMDYDGPRTRTYRVCVVGE